MPHWFLSFLSSSLTRHHSFLQRTCHVLGMNVPHLGYHSHYTGVETEAHRGCDSPLWVTQPEMVGSDYVPPLYYTCHLLFTRLGAL